MSRSASGGVSVRVGPSADFKNRRVRARRERVRDQGDAEVARATGALLCSECGRLTWPSGSSSPHRSSDLAPHNAPCPHCESRAWIDLRRESTAIAIREGEQGLAAAESPTVDTLRKAGLGMVVGSFLGILATSSVVAGLCIAALAGVAGGLAAVRLRRMSVPVERTLPDRWSLALPPATPGTNTTAEGLAQCAAPLRSPLTGRECIAYEVGLRSDSSHCAELFTWALLEQRVAPMSLHETPVDPATTFVELPRETLGELSSETLDPPAIEWFLERGFSSIGSSLIVYESIVPPQARVSLTSTGDGAVLRFSPGSGRKSLAASGERQQAQP